jgi:hypothetical protein
MSKPLHCCAMLHLWVCRKPNALENVHKQPATIVKFNQCVQLQACVFCSRCCASNTKLVTRRTRTGLTSGSLLVHFCVPVIALQRNLGNAVRFEAIGQSTDLSKDITEAHCLD